MLNQVDIKYLNKDFTSFRSDLIEYAKAYYPTVYNDFTQASPGSMFIEMASYVGDVLSFYLDNQIQETYLQYSKQKGNLYTMAYMLGYRPKVTSAATVMLDVYQQVPSITSGSSVSPDFTYAMTIEQGMQVKSNVDSSVLFYVPQKVDFTTSSSYDPTTVEVYTINGSNVPTSYLLKKSVQAISGQVKTQTFTFGAAQRFTTINLQDSNIITILEAKDSSGNTWYEVPYLAQDYILKPVQNTAANYPSLYQYQNQVPYITFQYLVGGGASSNVLTGQLTEIVSYTVSGNTTYQNTIVTNNPEPAAGGGDGDSVEQLRFNIAAEYPTQLRAVTQEDYLARVMSMPAQYGEVAKAYLTKDDATFRNYMNQDPGQRDPLSISLYVLGLNSQGQLDVPSPAILQNIQTYLKDYRMLTDAVNIKPGYIINIGCNFDIIIRPNYTSQDVIARSILALQDYFNIDNWQINEPIILGDIYTILDQVEGVQTVKTVSIVNKTGIANGYSKYAYDISAGTLNGVIYPSLDPSIFEVKYLNQDIQGRVVTI